eukprot:6213851-Pleurochrysis_carterae.AAC.5
MDKTAVNIDRSPARGWVAAKAETADDTLAADDDTGSEIASKCISETECRPTLRAAALPPRRRSNPSNHRQSEVRSPNPAAARPAHQPSSPQLPLPLPSESNGRPDALQRCPKDLEHVPSSAATRQQRIMRTFRGAKNNERFVRMAACASHSSLYTCSTTA